jgi:hypothetical protein
MRIHRRKGKAPVNRWGFFTPSKVMTKLLGCMFHEGGLGLIEVTFHSNSYTAIHTQQFIHSNSYTTIHSRQLNHSDRLTAIHPRFFIRTIKSSGAMRFAY